MKKSVQIEINERAEREFENAMNEMNNESIDCGRLRSCSARVYATKNYYILKSYNTCVACLNKKTGVVTDMMRSVYGYTATSSQHVSKFANDFREYSRGNRLTWRSVA